MSKKLEFQILGTLPSANNLLRMHWAKRRKMIQDWAWAVKASLLKVGCNHIGNTSYFKTKVQIDVIVFVGTKRSLKDESNLITPIDKLIVDNLIAQKILVDDSTDYLCWAKIEQKIGRPERIEIKLSQAWGEEK